MPENEDISLSKRVHRANALYRQNTDSILVSIHANAAGGTGYEVFTSPGQTTSDVVATVFFKKTEEEFPEEAMRPAYGDGDPDKEAKFYVLRKTLGPAILTENW